MIWHLCPSFNVMLRTFAVTSIVAPMILSVRATTSSPSSLTVSVIPGFLVVFIICSVSDFCFLLVPTFVFYSFQHQMALLALPWGVTLPDTNLVEVLARQ